VCAGEAEPIYKIITIMFTTKWCNKLEAQRGFVAERWLHSHGSCAKTGTSTTNY